MNYRVNILVIVMLISAPVFLRAGLSDNKPSQEYPAINRTINYYFHGVEMYDVEALKKAYHPDANLSFIDKETGALEQFNATQYFAMIAEAPHVVQERSLHVKSIDITGNAALAKPEIIYDRRGQRISDYLSLLKVDGAWKIVNRTSYKDYATFGGKPNGAPDASEIASIDKVAWTYLVGADDYDLNAFEESLHPTAAEAFVNEKNGALQALSRPEYMTLYAGMTGERGGRQEIQAVEMTGDMAMAKVHTYYRQYKAAATAYLVLMKSEGQWQIVHKITHKDKKAFLAPA